MFNLKCVELYGLGWVLWKNTSADSFSAFNL